VYALWLALIVLKYFAASSVASEHGFIGV